jgi:hypothetical protein
MPGVSCGSLDRRRCPRHVDEFVAELRRRNPTAVEWFEPSVQVGIWAGVSHRAPAARLVEPNGSRRARYECHGEARTLSEWSKYLGISRQARHQRLRTGWSLERALSEPPDPVSQRYGSRRAVVRA